MILQTTLFLLVISLVGLVTLKKTLIENRLFRLIPASMIWGISIYIFLLNFTSKWLPGGKGIQVATILLLVLGVGSLNFRIPGKIKFNLHNLIPSLIIVCLILATFYFARLKMTAILPVADSNMQWAYAASFARGNFPIKVPWQSDLNPNYHLGTYFLEGAILSIFKLPLITIHSLLNTYFLTAGALFTMFIFWETKYSLRNIWLISTTCVLYISYGVVIFILPGLDFLKDIPVLLTKFPPDIFAKGTAGASLVDLNSLSYLPARSLSLGIAFLALYFSLVEFKNLNIKVLFFIILFAVCALVEESMFLPLVAVFVVTLLISKQKKVLLKILILTTFVVIIQGGFFTDFIAKQEVPFTTQNESAFKIIKPFFDPAFMNQLQKLIGFTIVSNSTSLRWFIPGPFWLAVILLIYCLFNKRNESETKSIFLLAVYSLACMLSFLFIEYKYSPSNNIRFLNFAAICSGIGIFYLLFFEFKDKSLVKNSITFILITIFILVPTLLPEFINQNNQIKEARSADIRSKLLIEYNPQTPFENIGDWASKHLPANSRLISIDTDQPNPNRSLQFQYKGIYTILGPQYIRTLRPEPGTEYFDLHLALNPTLLKQTKTEYVYVESESSGYQNLPKERKDDLDNNKYFQLLSSVDTKDSSGKDFFYRLYKVLPEFLNESSQDKDIKDGMLTQLQSIVPNESSIYIADYGDPPKFSFWYRMAVILALKNKDIRRRLSQTDYQAIETKIPYSAGTIDERYDFYILSPNEKLSFPAKLVWSSLYANAWRRL